MVRCSAAFVGTALVALVVILLALVFYGRLFHWAEWRTLIFPTVITLLPPLVFALGSGWALGRFRSWLLYLWMLFPVVWIALPLPGIVSASSPAAHLPSGRSR